MHNISFKYAYVVSCMFSKSDDRHAIILCVWAGVLIVSVHINRHTHTDSVKM